jgi:glycosyltransferase involved in cell wall biosynthesis
MLVGGKLGDDPDVRLLPRGTRWAAVDRLALRVTDRLSLQYLVNASSFALRADPWFRGADVLQLYNIHGGYFAHTALPLLTRARPTVWRLSDMWAATGHCGYSYGCERWRTGCGECPHLKDYPALRDDRTAANWRVKREIYRRSRLVLVAPSRWLAGIATESPLLGRFPVRVIRNGVELDLFHPRPREDCRRALGLAPERPVVLVGSLERRKGAELLAGTLARVAEGLGPLTAVVTGERGVALEPAPGVEVIDLGLLDDRQRLALAYGAADLLLYPTLADNVPNTVLESMASGVPAVGLARGGLPEAVEHLEDGLLVEEANEESLAAAVASLLAERPLLERLGRRAAEKARQEFSTERQAGEFLRLYDELVAHAA